MKIPPLSEPFSFFRIGAAPYRISKQPDALSHIGPSHGSKAPSSPISPRLPAHELITIQRGSQDHIFGIPVSLKGQLNSICVFHDAILPSETKELFDGGKSKVQPALLVLIICSFPTETTLRLEIKIFRAMLVCSSMRHTWDYSGEKQNKSR